MCKSNTPVVQEDIGEADESNRMEIGLLNVDSHSNRGIEWTDYLELAIIIILILAVVRVLMKYCKKQNERRLRMMGNTVANMMSAVPPSTQSIHMTSLPILRTARGPTIQSKETTPGTLAIQGPISTVSESSPGVNFEAWKV